MCVCGLVLAVVGTHGGANHSAQLADGKPTALDSKPLAHRCGKACWIGVVALYGIPPFPLTPPAVTSVRPAVSPLLQCLLVVLLRPRCARVARCGSRRLAAERERCRGDLHLCPLPPPPTPPVRPAAASASPTVRRRSCALASSPLVRRVVPTLRSSSWTPPRSSAGAAWNIHVAASAPTGVLVRTLLRSDVQSLAACSPWRCRPRQPRCPTEPTPLRPSWIYGGCRASPCRWARSACWACLADLPSRCPCTGVVHVITRKRQRCPAPWSRSLCPPAAGAVGACRPVRWFCRGARHTRRCSGEPRPWLGPCRA